VAVLTCPLCAWRVNAAATHCPQCGADVHLESSAARTELARRLGPGAVPSAPAAAPGRLLTRRRLTVLVTLAVLVVLVLALPLIAGYFGPTAAVYATDWRPWRSHLKVQLTHAGSRDASLTVSYHDPWPGTGLSPGLQFFFVYAHRGASWLPWTVSSQGTGP